MYKINLKTIKNIFKPKTKYRSKPEQELHTLLINDVGVKSIQINNRSILKGKELDIYMPNRNLAIEYNGLYWHSYPFLKLDIAKSKHRYKTKECDKLDINLFHIWEDEWIFNKNNVINIIKLHTSNEIFRDKLVKNLKIVILKNKKDSYPSFFRYSIQKFNKSIAHQKIYKIMNDNDILSYIQVSNNVVKNIAVHNELLSFNELIHTLKQDNKFKFIFFDLSTGLHNHIKCKQIKYISPKSRLIKSKKRTKYANNGNIIWDCGYGIFELK